MAPGDAGHEDREDCRDDVASIVERELGDTPDSVARLDEGLLHDTYVVECGGRGYVLQFTSAVDDDRVDSLGRGLGCYRLLAASSVPVPQVVTDTVRSFAGREYALVERLPGESGALAVTPERVRDAGRHLARIHDEHSFETAGWLRFNGGEPVVDAFGEADLGERLRAKIPGWASTLRSAGIEAGAAAFEHLFEDPRIALPGAASPVLCHGDFSPDNLRFDGDAVVGVVDFDRARADHPQWDLAAAATGFWMHDPGAGWNPRMRFYEGYRDERDPGENFDAFEPACRVAALAKVCAGMIELDEFTEYEREFYDDELVAAVERAERVGGA